MILRILTVPDPALKKSAQPVGSITPRIRALADDLAETMNSMKNCVGIAAPQVGESVRLIVVNTGRNPRASAPDLLRVLINPRIIHFSDEKRLGREGCLSVPELTGNVMRSTSVMVEALDRNGCACNIAATGFDAVVLQHEIDHLDGHLFIDRVSSFQTDVFRRKNI